MQGKSLTIEGVDFVEVNAALQLTSLKVMFRPLGATLAFAKQMRTRLMAAQHQVLSESVVVGPNPTTASASASAAAKPAVAPINNARSRL